MKKFIIKLALIVFVLIVGIFIISTVEFPAPYKKIEKIIPNEKFKPLK
tara:strand:- start:2730 stop:2873 length:144 start_codon:yes stop_codon:yes gene_type:complete